MMKMKSKLCTTFEEYDLELTEDMIERCKRPIVVSTIFRFVYVLGFLTFKLSIYVACFLARCGFVHSACN